MAEDSFGKRGESSSVHQVENYAAASEGDWLSSAEGQSIDFNASRDIARRQHFVHLKS